MSDPAFSRPLNRVLLPKDPARVNLSERLVSGFGFSQAQADAIARAVVDPTAVRHQIDHLSDTEKFPDGTAYFLTAEVFTPGVAASLVNPREAEYRIYPAAVLPGDDIAPPLDIAPAEHDLPVLVLTADSRKHVEREITRSADILRTRASLRDEIAQDGVLRPVTIVVAEIRHRDGTPSAVVLVSIDGSTRTTFCHDLASFTPVEIIYRWPAAPSREWRGRLNQTLAVQDLPLDELTPSKAAAHRAMTYPARILIKIEPVREGPPVTIVDACRAVVGGIHIGRPEEWPEGSRYDEIADTVLARLVRDGRIASEVAAYFAGRIPMNKWAEHDFSPHPDVRAASIARTLYDERNARSISAGYRVVTSRQQLRANEKAAIVTELMMRTFRHQFNNKERDGVRSALQRTISWADFRSSRWAVTNREPDALLEIALAEQHAGTSLGPAMLELGMLGAYWLIAARVIRRDTPQSQDSRAGAGMINAMLRSPHGLYMLHRAIVDGRVELGRQDSIRAVDTDGQLIRTASGGLQTATDAWLRRTFTADGEAPIDGNASLEAQRDQAYLNIRIAVDRLRDVVQASTSVLAQEGLALQVAAPMAADLRKMGDKLIDWGAVYTAKLTQQGLAFFEPVEKAGEKDQVDIIDQAEIQE
jgi:hypothetical protein